MTLHEDFVLLVIRKILNQMKSLILQYYLQSSACISGKQINTLFFFHVCVKQLTSPLLIVNMQRASCLSKWFFYTPFMQNNDQIHLFSKSTYSNHCYWLYCNLHSYVTYRDSYCLWCVSFISHIYCVCILYVCVCMETDNKKYFFRVNKLEPPHYTGFSRFFVTLSI